MDDDYRLFHAMLIGIKKEMEPLTNSEKEVRAKKIVGAVNIKLLMKRLYE